MIDPPPLSREVAHHEARSAFFRLKADTAVAHILFTGVDNATTGTSGAAPRSRWGNVLLYVLSTYSLEAAVYAF